MASGPAAAAEPGAERGPSQGPGTRLWVPGASTGRPRGNWGRPQGLDRDWRQPSIT